MLKELTRWMLIGLTVVNLTLAVASIPCHTCIIVDRKNKTVCCGEVCGPGGCSGACSREELSTVSGIMDSF